MQGFSYATLPYKREIDRALRHAGESVRGGWYGQTSKPIGPIPIDPNGGALEAFLGRLVGLAGEKHLTAFRVYRGTRDLDGGEGVVVVEENNPRAGAAWVIFEVQAKGPEAFVTLHQAWPSRRPLVQSLICLWVALGFATPLCFEDPSKLSISPVRVPFVLIILVLAGIWWFRPRLRDDAPPIKSQRAGEVLFTIGSTIVARVLQDTFGRSIWDGTTVGEPAGEPPAHPAPPNASW